MGNTVAHSFYLNDSSWEAYMTPDKLSKFWLLATFLLIAIIVISSLVIWSRRSDGQPIEISPPQPSGFSGNIYVEGAVSNPGIYPLQSGDSLESIIQSSGGTAKSADLNNLHLYIPQNGESQQPQKIDINRADIWLLEALPEIGNVKAQAIVQYRQINGPFHRIDEITKVPGINTALFEKIKNLITLSD
jgi:competence protein ComEA